MVVRMTVSLLVASLVGLLICETSAVYLKHPRNDHWGVNLTTPELIAAFGYPVEIHQVTTEDGYILEMHRIPHGISGPTPEGRPVALLEHCLLCSSSDYVMNDPSEALAYILADAGYDVWLANMRGNTYGRHHVSLDPEDNAFWKFSWDEIGYYDLPASIDYVLEKTGTDGVYYAGWSMGTTSFWVMMSERPEYNDKVKAMAALAPVAYVGNAIGPLKEIAKYTDQLSLLFDLLGIGEFLPDSDVIQYFAENYCDMNSTTSQICYNVLFLIGGPDADELNEEYIPVILSHTPAGSSTHTVVHYAQMMNSNEFCKYDFGLIGNLEHYGQSTPPLYNLSRVTAPVGLFWGNTDWLADPTDVARLAEGLGNVALNYNVPKEEWNHFDFGWAIHANEYVYTKVLEFYSGY